MASLILRSGEPVLFDEEDAPEILARRWSRQSGKSKHGALFYARCTELMPVFGGYKRTQRLLHRMILGYPKGIVDHINGNGLDNRRSNLRLCTHSQNRQNAANFGRFLKGVNRGNYGGYQAFISGQYIGTFETEYEAALAYDRAAKKTFGEFARLNFPDAA